MANFSIYWVSLKISTERGPKLADPMFDREKFEQDFPDVDYTVVADFIHQENNFNQTKSQDRKKKMEEAAEILARQGINAYDLTKAKATPQVEDL